MSNSTQLRSILFGLGLSAAFSAALPLALRSLPPPADLQAEIPSDKSYRIVADPAHFTAPPIQVGPPEFFRRIRAQGLPQSLAPGLHLSTWSMNYGHRWEREISFASLIGPFAPEGTPICDLALRLSPELFDTEKAGAGMKKAMDQKLSAFFPMTLSEGGISIHFPSIEKTDFRIALEPNLAVVSLSITLKDKTLLSARFPMKLVSSKAKIELVRAGPVESQWTGPTREQARKAGADLGAGVGAGLGILAGLLIGGPTGAAIGGKIGSDAGAEYGGKTANRIAGARSHSEILRTIDTALVEMSLGLSALTSPIQIFPDRPNDRLQLTLAQEPKITPQGMAFSLCASLKLGEPKINSAVAGSLLSAPNTIVSSTQSAYSKNPAGVELIAGENALNLFIYALFQSGMMRMLGNSNALLSTLPPTLQGLAFDMNGFDPELPPALMNAPLDNPTEFYGIPLILANIQMGTWGKRRVLGHGSAFLTLQERAGDFTLSASIKHLTVNCAEAISDNKTRLTPCLSDLLPAARDLLMEKPLTLHLPVRELLTRLPKESLMGMQVDWSEPKAELSNQPIRLRLSIQPRLNPKAP